MVGIKASGVIGTKINIVYARNGRYLKRTWKERLLSWPWRPWVARKWDVSGGDYVIPNGQVLRDEQSGLLLMNPLTHRQYLEMQTRRIRERAGLG